MNAHVDEDELSAVAVFQLPSLINLKAGERVHTNALVSETLSHVFSTGDVVLMGPDLIHVTTPAMFRDEFWQAFQRARGKLSALPKRSGALCRAGGSWGAGPLNSSRALDALANDMTA